MELDDGSSTNDHEGQMEFGLVEWLLVREDQRRVFKCFWFKDWKAGTGAE
jgi:hypothetical protein